MASTINASNSGFGGIVSTGDSSGQLQLQTAGTTAVTIDTSQNATFAGKVTSAGALTLASNGTTTALTIDTSQNVGIGTASPSSKLHVAGGSGSTIRNTASAGSSWFVGSNVDSYILHNESNTPMLFTTNGTERMRIDSSGNCFWNGTSIIENTKYNFYFTSSTNGIGSKTDTASTSYHVRWHNTNGVVGGVYTNGSNTTYTTSSDYRLKDNITPMTGALDKVMQLNPVTYTWKSDSSNGQGFIAHELQAIVPECVGGEKDAVNEDGSINPQGVDTSFLVATLTAAIQEQQALITSLTARITALEAK